MNPLAAAEAPTMGLFKKKPDPISERARALEQEIAALEAQIQRLSDKPTAPTRAEAEPLHASRTGPSPTKAVPMETPVFEKVNLQRVTSQPEANTTSQFNEQGVRKFDLVGAWRRLMTHFRGPGAHNPQLISYLASGTIQGLRPLRYEKRVARNRFAALFALLVLTLWGIAYVFFKRR